MKTFVELKEGDIIYLFSAVGSDEKVIIECVVKSIMIEDFHPSKQRLVLKYAYLNNKSDEICTKYIDNFNSNIHLYYGNMVMTTSREISNIISSVYQLGMNNCYEQIKKLFEAKK